MAMYTQIQWVYKRRWRQLVFKRQCPHHVNGCLNSHATSLCLNGNVHTMSILFCFTVMPPVGVAIIVCFWKHTLSLRNTAQLLIVPPPLDSLLVSWQKDSNLLQWGRPKKQQRRATNWKSSLRTSGMRRKPDWTRRTMTRFGKHPKHTLKNE